jgi:sulfatase modifying factor 1
MSPRARRRIGTAGCGSEARSEEVSEVSARARSRIRTAAAGAACFLGVCATGACSTVLGIGDWTNLTDDGGPDAMTGGSESTAQGGPDSTTPEKGLDAPSGDADSEVRECTAPETKCVGSAVATCTANGTYGAAVPCASAMCAMGVCRASCEAGASQCSGNSAVQTCESGMWATPTTCTNQTCVPATATCTGVCAPSQTHPIGCGNCGTNTQTCSSSGAWQDATCTGQGACAQNLTQSCNTYGTQTCSSSCAWGGCSCGSAPVCTPNAKQCSGNGVQTCNACGQWGSAVGCSGSTTPFCANGVCTSPPSCQTSGAGLTNCGASSESCCTSLEVTGGTYYRTYTNSGSGPTGEADPASVSGFRLDKYLVTVGRFRQFVNAWNGGSGWMPPAGSGKHTHLNGGNGLNATGGGYEPGWDATDWNNNITDIDPTNANLICAPDRPAWTTAAGSQENLPMNCVTWWESYAFCIWDGGFLPSESEWEYVAAGGSQQREYPWGTTAPGTGNQYAIYNCDYPSGPCFEGSNSAPVGTATQGAGLWGQLDLAGEVWEWNLDWYASYVDSCTDCADLSSASNRVTRGGSFDGPASDLLPPIRSDNDSPPAYRIDDVGLRCARTP